jgi:hypothetical protein
MQYDDERVQRMIQRRLKGGALPSDAPAQVLNGASSGRFCAACCRYLTEGEPEIQAVDGNGGSTYFHPVCYNVTASLRLLSEGRAPRKAA